MRRLLTCFALSFLHLVLVAGCDCEGPPDEMCASASECAAGQLCVDGRCEDAPDGGPGTDASTPPTDAGECADLCGAECCGDGEECVDDFQCAPICENTRCGDNRLTCCVAGQVCLDGVVCAASCEAGRALCGAALDVCCGEGEVCLSDACVAPGDTCGDDFDCLEEGTYCEPTIGRCLDNPPPPLCEVRPEFDRVALEIEWHWPGVMVDGVLYANVITAPMVGDVSGDGIPDVVVSVYAERGVTNNLDTTILAAIHGGTGATLFIRSGADGANSQGTVALANLDPSDEALEIVYATDDGEGNTLIVLDGDGITELARLPGGTATRYASPAVHDLDRDGTPEIVVGGRVFDFTEAGGVFTLSQRFGPFACQTEAGAHSTVANLDADPELEITCGGVAYDTDGTLMWPLASTAVSGYSAVADLDLDGDAEVVHVEAGQVYVRAGATGELLMGVGGAWYDGSLAIPGAGEGGPPTIADFDGDGLPEISAAGRGAYAVYDPDCIEPRIAGRESGNCERAATGSGVIRWAAPVQDFSSSRTGSSVFDFQGDGIAEVVYADECFLHVLDGRDGAEILMEPWANTSRTSAEYPVVVDVDRDGNSEIVLVANNDEIERDNCRPTWVTTFGYASEAEIPDRFRDGTQGVFALGDPGDRWVRTRPIWNQHTYAVTHVDDRGVVPATPPDNWTVPGLNNFRQNVQGEGVFNAPNLTVSLDVVAACGAGEIRLSAIVRNEGSRGVPAGVPVEVVRTEPAPEVVIATTATTQPLLPGASERVTVVATEQPYDVTLRFAVTVDGDTSSSTITECNEDDNGAEGTELCPGLM